MTQHLHTSLCCGLRLSGSHREHGETKQDSTTTLSSFAAAVGDTLEVADFHDLVLLVDSRTLCRVRGSGLVSSGSGQ